MTIKSTNYRPAIDGLRALAILPVIIFHAFPKWIPGGFIGVDIFFVISGFLITSILLQDLSINQYSVKSFYARRVRRIFPALGVVLFIFLLWGWMVLTPEEYQKLGKHAAGGVGFVANFIFWKEVGYFDPAADTKPFIHLWSLGIEEQFYIFWPLLLAFAYKRRWSISLVIGLIAIVSFGLNVWKVHTDVTAAFYSPLTRSWELAIGAWLAVQAFTNNKSINHLFTRYANPISILGLVLIVLGLICIREGNTFPGYWALLPSLGAACLIASGEDSWVNQQLFSRPLMVGIGLISFPLYLWHWPLLSFARIINSEAPAVEIRIVLLAISIVLAWLTYQFLEKPIRATKISKRMIWILTVTLLVIGISGHLINKSKGVPSRQFNLLNADPASLAMGADRSRLLNECGVSEAEKSILQICYTDPRALPTMALWGDSKGEALFYGLARESSPRNTWMMLGNMFPVTSNDPIFEKAHLERNKIALSALLKNERIKVVVLGGALRSAFGVPDVYTADNLANSPRYFKSLEGLDATISALEKGGKQVVFFMDHPGFPDPKSCIGGGMTHSDFLNHFFYRRSNPHCSMTFEDFKKNSQRYSEMVNILQQRHPRLYVYDPSPLLCDISHNRCEISKDGQFLYSYGDHLSDDANSMIAKDLLPKILKLIKD